MKKLFMNPNLNLEDIRESLPNRLRSFQEQKSTVLRDEIEGRANGTQSPSRRHTLAEIEVKVKSGLERARRITGTNENLLSLVDSLESLWDGLRDQLLTVSVGLSAMNFRTEDQILSQLIQYRDAVDRVETSDSWSVSGIIGNA